MRVSVLCVLLPLLGGCETGDATSDTLVPDTVTARFVPGGLANVIVVTAVDRMPLRSAVLVAPGGERVSAYSLDVDRSPIIVEVPGEASLRSTPGAPHRVARMDTMLSTALIQLPDPVRYAKSWEEWRVELRLGDADTGERALTLAAPASPPI
jgi:hypothetical protein